MESHWPAEAFSPGATHQARGTSDLEGKFQKETEGEARRTGRKDSASSRRQRRRHPGRAARSSPPHCAAANGQFSREGRPSCALSSHWTVTEKADFQRARKIPEQRQRFHRQALQLERASFSRSPAAVILPSGWCLAAAVPPHSRGFEYVVGRASHASARAFGLGCGLTPWVLWSPAVSPLSAKLCRGLSGMLTGAWLGGVPGLRKLLGQEAY